MNEYANILKAQELSIPIQIVNIQLKLFQIGSKGGFPLRELGKNPDMCRNIKTLFNFDPPASQEEIEASALQFVRKLSGTRKPSKANEAVFQLAVDRVTAAATDLLNNLTTQAPSKNREEEAEKARERNRKRFG